MIFLLFTKSSIEEKNFSKSFSKASSDSSLGKIGEGALALGGFVKKTPLPDLKQEVVLIAKNPFPKSESKKADFLLTLRSSGDEYKARSGEMIFLSCDSSAGGLNPIYRFSEVKTPLWIKPEYTDKEEVFLDVGLFTLSKENGSFTEEKSQIVLDFNPSFRKKKETLPFIEMLENAKVWGQDVVLGRFTGEKYKHLKDALKVEIIGKGKRSFCFLKKGDVLFFDGESWVPLQASKEENRPVARVKQIRGKTIEFDVWDSESFSSMSIKLEPSPVFAFGTKADNLPHSLRMKNQKQLSCSFGKRKYLPKEGDWFVKTKRGWRQLRRSFDKEEYLRHKILGEMFIFESLVKEQGKWMMKGFLIDEMRTQVHPFSALVVTDPSREQLRGEKKQESFKKLDLSPTTYLFPIANQNTDEIEYE